MPDQMTEHPARGARKGLMQHWPLLTTKLIDYAAKWHSDQAGCIAFHFAPESPCIF